MSEQDKIQELEKRLKEQQQLIEKQQKILDQHANNGTGYDESDQYYDHDADYYHHEDYEDFGNGYDEEGNYYEEEEYDHHYTVLENGESDFIKHDENKNNDRQEPQHYEKLNHENADEVEENEHISEKSDHEMELDTLFAEHDIDDNLGVENDANEYTEHTKRTEEILESENNGNDATINDAFEKLDNLFKQNVNIKLVARKWVKKHRDEKGNYKNNVKDTTGDEDESGELKIDNAFESLDNLFENSIKTRLIAKEWATSHSDGKDEIEKQREHMNEDNANELDNANEFDASFEEIDEWWSGEDDFHYSEFEDDDDDEWMKEEKEWIKFEKEEELQYNMAKRMAIILVSILIFGGGTALSLYVVLQTVIMLTLFKYILSFTILLLVYVYFDYDQVRVYFEKKMRMTYAILYLLAAGSFSFSVSLSGLPLTRAWNLTLSGSCIITMLEVYITSTPQFKSLPRNASRFAPWIWRVFMTVQPSLLASCYAFEEFNYFLTLQNQIPTKGFLLGSVIAGISCTSWLIFESSNVMLHHMHRFVQVFVHFLFLISVCLPCATLGGMFDDDLYRIVGVFGRDLMVLIFLMGAVLAGG